MKSAILLLLLLGWNTCFSQTCELNGHITGLGSDSLLILKIKGDGFEGVKIKATQNTFHYKFEISTPYFVQLFRLTSSKAISKLAEFIAEPGLIHINGQSANFENVEITGSKTNLVLQEYLKQDQKLVDQWGKLKTSYDLLASKKDSVKRKEIGSAMNNILTKERIPLLKKYVSINKNSIVGALLPNFCMLKDVLKKEDYLEMYNALSSEVKTSDYAKSILSKGGS